MEPQKNPVAKFFVFVCLYCIVFALRGMQNLSSLTTDQIRALLQ